MYEDKIIIHFIKIVQISLICSIIMHTPIPFFVTDELNHIAIIPFSNFKKRPYGIGLWQACRKQFGLWGGGGGAKIKGAHLLRAVAY